MRRRTKAFRGLVVVGVVAVLMSLLMASVSLAKDYDFSVLNSTSSTIKQLLVREAGGDWGYFDIGSGIKPGQSAQLVWASSTDNEDCDQWIKAVYADGSESEPVKFDFCEEKLELEFQ